MTGAVDAFDSSDMVLLDLPMTQQTRYAKRTHVNAPTLSTGTYTTLG